MYPTEGATTLRAAIVYYLIFAVAAGPAGFCCCTYKFVVAALCPEQVTLTTRPSPTQEKGSCPHCKQHLSDSSQEPEKPKAPSRDSQERCPCKETRGTAVVNASAPEYTHGWTSEQIFSIDLAPQVSGYGSPNLIAVSREGMPPGVHDGPWLSAQDLLCAHHVIRC